jgi:ABC-2 type transport system ATP-binding protein
MTGHSPLAIQLRALTKQYAGTTALKGIDLDVREGEFFGLLGPNGAGKSTTINIMAGLCVKSSGDVKLFGYDLVRQYRDCRRVVGLVPQEFNFDTFGRLRSILLFQGGYFGVPRAECERRVDRLLDEFQLREKQTSQMRQLSGGMKRRAIIARALVHEPRLLILDEPTAGVDVDQRKALWVFLRKLKEQGTTILLTTHYIEEAEALCDRIAIIDHGQIVADDSTRNMVNRLGREAIVVTCAEAIPDGALAQLAQHAPALSPDRHEVTLVFDRQKTQYTDVLQQLLASGLRVTSLRPNENRLEQVYRQLTGGVATK